MKNFEISAVLDIDVPHEKVDGKIAIRNLLNEKLLLQKYSDSINTLYIVFQVISPSNKARKVEEFLKHRKKTNALELYLTVDYFLFLESDTKEATYLLADTYMKGIDLFLCNRKDFDGKRFFKDVKSIFEEYGMLRLDIEVLV